MICWALDDSAMDEPQSKKHKHHEIKTQVKQRVEFQMRV